MGDGVFPWLGVEDYYPFPHADTADSQGIVAVGGNLSPGMLISAYSQGIFPWFSQDEPILWWSLDPRFVLYPPELHISRSMKKILKKGPFRYTLDRDFAGVIGGCAQSNRPGQDGTWITGEMEQAYCELHRLGFAHSVEVWQGDDLAAGLYGVSLGRAFFGESMFSRVPNGSKAGFILLTRLLESWGFSLIDCQQHTPHLGTLGARDVPRSDFLKQLHQALQEPSVLGKWHHGEEQLLSLGEAIHA